MADIDMKPEYRQTAWKAAGSPDGSYEQWLANLRNSGTEVRAAVGDPNNYAGQNNAGNTVASPATFEERLASGEFAGEEGKFTELEVRRRRQLLTDNHGMQPLPPDVADMVLRDPSGKLRKARASTTQSALGAAFDAKSSLFGDR